MSPEKFLTQIFSRLSGYFSILGISDCVVSMLNAFELASREVNPLASSTEATINRESLAAAILVFFASEWSIVRRAIITAPKPSVVLVILILI